MEKIIENLDTLYGISKKILDTMKETKLLSEEEKKSIIETGEDYLDYIISLKSEKFSEEEIEELKVFIPIMILKEKRRAKRLYIDT